jgi:RNA-binding protein YlmH
MIRFGDTESLGYELPFPIVTLKAAPVSEKFADRLTHRDLLGAIMNLGIERSVIGDIAIIDNVGYIFALESIAPYIVENLVRVRHTDMHTEIIDELPEGDLFRTESKTVQAVGERLDAIVAKVFNLSRDDAQSLFKKLLVFASGREIESTSYIPKENEVISVRGQGRFIYRGCASFSKKGKMNIKVDVYV